MIHIIRLSSAPFILLRFETCQHNLGIFKSISISAIHCCCFPTGGKMPHYPTIKCNYGYKEHASYRRSLLSVWLGCYQNKQFISLIRKSKLDFNFKFSSVKLLMENSPIKSSPAQGSLLYFLNSSCLS